MYRCGKAPGPEFVGRLLRRIGRFFYVLFGYERVRRCAHALGYDLGFEAGADDAMENVQDWYTPDEPCRE